MQLHDTKCETVLVQSVCNTSHNHNMPMQYKKGSKITLEKKLKTEEVTKIKI